MNFEEYRNITEQTYLNNNPKAMKILVHKNDKEISTKFINKILRRQCQTKFSSSQNNGNGEMLVKSIKIVYRNDNYKNGNA